MTALRVIRCPRLIQVRAESGGLSKFSGQFTAWYFGDGDADPWDDFECPCMGKRSPFNINIIIIIIAIRTCYY